MECFKQIAAHMLKGLMYHRDMEDYLRFLGFEKLADEQRMHYLDESNNFACLHKEYLTLQNQLLNYDLPAYEPIIPESWYEYTTADVDNNTRQKFLRSVFQIWVNWERDTVCLYEDSIQQCRAAGCESGALIIQKYLKDVLHELHALEQRWTDLEICDWDPCKVLILETKE